jgi:hypothetical protein
MLTSLNVDTALLQEAIALKEEIAIETLVEIALREYIQRRKQPQHLELSFGESLSAFREKYQVHELGLNPDEVWGEIRGCTASKSAIHRRSRLRTKRELNGS